MLMSFECISADDPPFGGTKTYELTCKSIGPGTIQGFDRYCEEGDVVAIAWELEPIDPVPDQPVTSWTKVKSIEIRDAGGSPLSFQLTGPNEISFIMPASEVDIVITFIENGLPDLQFWSHPSWGMIADESAIGMVNQKTTAVRIIPVVGKEVGDTVEFGGLLGYAPVMPVNRFSCEAFVNRGGRIPAPIHSFKN